MSWLGIDPGLTGAVALIQPDGRVRFWDTPFTVTVDKGEKTKAGNPKVRRRYDRPKMVSILSAAQILGEGGVSAVIEDVHAMPKQGISGAFSFGLGKGLWLGILEAKMIPLREISPVRWTRMLLRDLPKRDGAAVVRASELYPAIAGQLRSRRGALLLGRADALLLAHYGRLTTGDGLEGVGP